MTHKRLSKRDAALLARLAGRYGVTLLIEHLTASIKQTRGRPPDTDPLLKAFLRWGEARGLTLQGVPPANKSLGSSRSIRRGYERVERLFREDPDFDVEGFWKVRIAKIERENETLRELETVQRETLRLVKQEKNALDQEINALERERDAQLREIAALDRELEQLSINHPHKIVSGQN